MSLKEFLFADLERQYLVAGLVEKKANWVKVLRASLSPRFMPIVIFRLSHWFYLNRLSPLAKIFSLINFVIFGLEIAIKCEIGGGLYLPHTQGTVIGASKIGINATIYHNVTLGARQIDLVYAESSRPWLGDNVIVGAGAKVLGSIRLENNSRVGPNAVVLEDVPEGSIVVVNSGQVIMPSKKP
jgi:serine O-acetyltransferase